jgi:MFS family permease
VNKPAQPGIYFGWYIASACFLIFFFTNGLSIFVPQNLFPRFMETFGATEGEISGTVALMFLLTAPLAPLAGVLIDRLGPLRIMRAGLIIMAACFTLYPFAQSVLHLYLLHAGLAFGLVLGGLLASVTLLSRWFITRRGTVIGLLVSMSSLSGLILPNLISPLVNDPNYGWRWGFGALAAAFWIFALLPGLFLLKEKPSDVGQFPDGASEPPAARPDGSPDGVPFPVALRSRTLWVLVIGSTCLWFTFQAINSQITIFLELEAGLSPQNATRLYSVIFGFSVAGKFLFGAISDYLPKHRVMLATSTTLLIGCLLIFTVSDGALGLASGFTQLTLFTIIFGLGYGGSFTMIQLVCVESFGQRSLGKILGVVICFDSLGGMAGTILTGQMKTVTGSYLTPFLVVAVVALIAVINVILIHPIKRKS